MKMLLLHKGTARLAHLLHARLSPLGFLLNLSLFSLLARILLILSSSPHLHGVVLSTGAALRGLNLSPDAALWKACIDYKIELGQLFLLANLIILALLFLAKGGSTSFDARLNLLEGTDRYNALKPFDSLADHLHFDYDEPTLPSAPSDNKLAVASALPFELGISYGASTQQLLEIGTAAPSYNKLAVSPAPSDIDRSYHDACTPHQRAIGTAAPSIDLPSSPLHMNKTYTKHLELEPISQEINENPKYKTRPKSCRNQVELVNTYPYRISDNPSKAMSNAQDMRIHEHAHGSVPSPTRFPTRSNSMSVNPLELVPTTADITISHANPSQISLIRHKSDISASNRSANRHNYYGRTVNSAYYYEYARDEGCSTARLYTASTLDNLSAEEARKRFSDFASRKWKTIRKESQAECEASPPSELLRICADTK